ncbi:IDEAL domain-containing protein [Bacillus sp. FJAT-29790]|uniref:IDEAL domain-containing protein n=1 Tax=Bacillus sp. FJAT-29790 TaxID=1895002 RepID=UPI001C22C993|nr:IDEAL domain-containing protein [Bacillus sp. FJAT-29790]
MKKYLLNSPHQPEENLDSQIAEKILNNALQAYRREKLKMEIDQTLSDRNKEEFLRLTEELKSIS